ncbi:uncharacterized protein LOC106134371 [Amyelois transitella]|uniref:uncharacterized protein LOC106134371 n=1 Tax=Amyelois transitella TaxID=680683 RepID=UPI00298FF319|nr:uncharacterized protein LOC106134371 [Amyelois transitella]
MQMSSRSKISELQVIISRMPLEVCCVTALPEFGIRWRDVSKAVRNARLPMTAASVARVLCRHVAKSLPAEELEDIVARLRLKLAASQSRTWHVIELSEKTNEDSVTMQIHTLAARVTQALRGRSRNMRPEVQSVLIDDLMYISIQLVSETKSSSVLFAATPPGEPVALVSSLGASSMLKGLVEGLGYSKYEDANLYGRDIRSLLRIHDRGWNENADHLTQIPDYQPAPVITNSGIDYTNKTYDSEYVDNLIGPDPPLLTDLNIRTTKSFFDPSRLNKQINLTVQLKSDDVAKTLKNWVMKSALAPTSDFFQIFHQIKSNKVTYCREDSD